MKFREFFSKKQILFSLLLFAILIPIAIWDSNTQVKVTFDAQSIYVRSDKYSLSVEYDAIVSAQLTELAEAGEKVEDGFDNDIIRCGVWENDTWGTYYIVADLDASNCVEIELKDGRIFVFSRKDNEDTALVYQELLTHLN